MFEPKDRMIGEQFAVLIANDDFTRLTDAECASYQDYITGIKPEPKYETISNEDYLLEIFSN